MKGRHRVVGIHAGFNKFRVAFFEFFLFHICIGERLGYANSGNTALQCSVDDRHCFPSSLESFSHFLSCDHGNQDQKGNAGEYNERESPINKSKIRKGNYDGDGANDEIFGTVVSKLGDFLKVAGHTGHDLAGFVCIEKGEGELFQMGKKVASHLCLHPYTHLMSFVLYEKVQKHTNDVNGKHQKSE